MVRTYSRSQTLLGVKCLVHLKYSYLLPQRKGVIKSILTKKVKSSLLLTDSHKPCIIHKSLRGRN